MANATWLCAWRKCFFIALRKATDNNSKRGGGDRAPIPAGFYRPDRDHLAGVVGVLEVLPRRAVRDRLNGEGLEVVQKELQSGILSYGLARGGAVEGPSLGKGSHVQIK